MPTHNATLDIRSFASSEPGWHDVQASNGQTYSYSYAGGDDGVGGMTLIIGQGRSTLAIRLIADRRYNFSDCTFAGAGQDQLDWNGSGQAGAIVDANTAVAEVKYSLIVTDTGNGNCTIPCDPMIRNQPQ